MTSPRPLPVWAGEFPGYLIEPLRPEESFRASFLDGLGECPAFAPYETESGGCSNFPADVSAHEFFQSGGALDAGVYSPVAASEQEESYGAVAVDPAIVAANAAARFGLQLTPDRETQERLISEMLAQAVALGVNVDNCEVYANSDPTGGVTMYGSTCDVNGNAAAPALVLREGGWSIALTAAAAAGGAPRTGQAAPVIVNGALYYPTPDNQYPWLAPASGGGGSAQPAATSPVPPSAGTPTQGAGLRPLSATARPSAGTGASVVADGAIERAQSLIAGLPPWALLAAAAGGFLLLNQSGGRR